jgi:hypothetical protein
MKKVIKYLAFVTGSLVLFSTNSFGQEDYQKEVSNIDEIVTALYASISGEKGEPRQWELFHTLFTENAQLIPTGKNEEGKFVFLSITQKNY